MAKKTLVKWLLGVALAVGVTALQADTAEAHLFHHGGSCGSCGSWGSCGSCGSWGSCGSCGGWGSYGSCGSWGSGGSCGSWGSCGSCGGYWGSYGSCGSCGSWGSCGCCGGGEYSAPIYSAPMESSPSMPAPTTAPPAPPPANGKSALNGDAGYIVVDVPADAKVFVNGHATTSTGEHRQYVSHGLENGMRYEYQVRVEVVHDGKVQSDTKTVELTAGSQASLAFDIRGSSKVPQTAKTGASPRTAVLLHVPADAKVFISGHEMTATGTDREFATTKLAVGQVWDNYTIRVVNNGESQEKTLTLKAGDSRELTFNFDAPKVASADR